jgi:hypothetical protein
MHQIRPTAFVFALLVLFALIALEPLSAQGQGPQSSFLATPDGLGTMAVLVADGAFDPLTPHPTVPGCFAAVCDGDYYQEVILGRSAAEIAAQEAAAKAFFLQRFGLDVDDPANAGRLFLSKFMFDPRIHYRLYALSGTRVPSEGWQVWDGGWSVFVIDPAGFTLGGEHAGIPVPAGTIFVFGDYRIDVTGPQGQPREPIVVHYQAHAPMIPDVYGSSIIRCRMIHEPWGGDGQGLGMFQPVPLAGGQVQFNLRNTMTFP